MTILKDFKPPNELHKANGKPFEYNGILYSPKYFKGEISRYEAQIKNLKIFMYPAKIYLINSLHKYWHGNNYSNFYLSECKEAIESLNEETGINWHDAEIRKCEYGCNIVTNAEQIISSMLSYKGKDYLPMRNNGKKCGVDCGFMDYKIKCYDKAFEVKTNDKIYLDIPVLRWEISMLRMRSIENKLNLQPVKVKHLLQKKLWQLMANDAILKYTNSVKMTKLNLYKLSTHEKRILAEMLVPEIREDLKRHNKETYKRDRRIYKRLMTDKSICINDNIPELLTQKFDELLNEKQIIEKSKCRLVV